MLDLLLQDDHLSGAHHRAILTALLAQGQPALALRLDLNVALILISFLNRIIVQVYKDEAAPLAAGRGRHPPHLRPVGQRRYPGSFHLPKVKTGFSFLRISSLLLLSHCGGAGQARQEAITVEGQQ